MNTASQQEIKQVIDELIQTATTYDVDTLERIYHDDLQVVMVGPNDRVNFANKATFKELFSAKRAAGDPPMDTWAKFHHIENNGENANVVLSRRNNLNGLDMSLFLSIDLIHENERWQVKREVISLRPLEQQS